MKQIIKHILLKVPFFKSYYLKKKSADGEFILENHPDLTAELEQAEKVLLDKPFTQNIQVGLVKDGFCMGAYISRKAYYLRYERFLKNNHIPYQYYDISASDWMQQAQNFDVIIWHPASDPASQKTAKDQIYVLEKLLKKKCIPSYNAIWTYEDKVNAHYLYQHFNLPEIPTFVSHSKQDALSFVENTKLPLISKIATGSASGGVEKINTKSEAIKHINEVFSYKGRKTYIPYLQQKDYICFQEFIDDAAFDLRIIVIGDKLWGYYRYPNKGDFRASGAGNYEKKEIPAEALDLAYKVQQCYQATFLATDLLYSEKCKQYLIIESSIFIGIDTCEQLVINRVPGYYKRLSEGNYSFETGRFWIQEWVLKEEFETL